MARVFLIGTGPLPMLNPREMGFPALRTRQFLLPLLAAGHEVTLACLTSREADAGEVPGQGETLELSVDTNAGARSFRYAVVRPDEPGRFLMLRDLRGNFMPDVTVTAGPFLPMAAGARAAGDEPLWIDVPGDPMSEAQARAYRTGSTDPIARYREMLGWALARGDRFSTISGAQRGALIGALGLAGRMTGDAIGHEWVHVVPGSVEGLLAGVDPATAPRPRGLPDLPEDAFVVLACGGYNTWLDGETMIDGLLRAMEKDPRIRFVSTGGALRGHDETSYHRFVERATASQHADRFHFLGWVPTETLPAVFAASHLCLFVDVHCYEAEFGARTRVLEALERGVPVAATDGCDLTHELAGCPMFFGLPEGDPQAVADVLLQLSTRHAAGEPIALDTNGDAPWSKLRERYTIETTTAPLLAWIEAPTRSPGGVQVDFLEDYWQELARLQDRLEEVWNSPTWRYLGRVNRMLAKLLGRG